jgi:ABC-type dipeptide/oligopeptide/nickel transport system permease component
LKTFLKKRKLLQPLLWFSQSLRFLLYLLSAIPILFAGALISTLSPMTYDQKLSVFSPNNLRILVIASLIVGIGDGFLAEVMRHSQDEIEYVLRQNYVRMTKALGRPFWQAAKNDLIIHTTRVFTSRLVVLISGVVVLEGIFNIPGIGMLVLYAADASDFYVLSGILSFTVFVVCILNFIHRIIATRLDPRL